MENDSMAQVRGTTEAGKAYTTDETDILFFQCPHNVRTGVVFFIYASTAGTAKVYYKDPGGTYRLAQTGTAVAANDLTTIRFPFPISETKLTYEGTSAGGTVNAEGRGF